MTDQSRGLRLVKISKRFGETQALKGVSFEVHPDEIVAVLGPSGCGKSTLLSVTAGLEVPDEGEVFWDGEPLGNVPADKRGFGLMFQDYALFPHLNVGENVAFGLRMQSNTRNQVRERVAAMLELVGLGGFAGRDANTLSGGEQQRVALARSLAPQPRLLMLDEPLGALDRNLRERLILELRSILRQIHQTAIYVTHDQQEAFILADRVVVLNAGKVEQMGSPAEVYHHPASLFVARFLGFSNLFPGKITQKTGVPLVETALGAFRVETQLVGDVMVLLRSDAIHMDEGGPCKLEGCLLEITFRGDTTNLVVEHSGLRLEFEVLSSPGLPAVGDQIRFYFDPQDAIQVLPRGA